MGYVLVGIGCFIFGSVSSFILFCLCKAASDNEQESNPCDGCFGAANNDCWDCPHFMKGGDKNAN